VSLEVGATWRVNQIEARFFGFTSFFDFTLFHQGLTPMGFWPDVMFYLEVF
jgi:hypothetical protein